MDILYNKLENQILLAALNINEFATSFSYMIDFKKHKNLKIEPYENSILVTSNEINIFIVLYVDFMENEYINLKTRKNIHFVTFDEVVTSMIEFKPLKIKYVNKNAWVSTTIALSNNTTLQMINLLLR